MLQCLSVISSSIDECSKKDFKLSYVEDEATRSKISGNESFISLVPISKTLVGGRSTAFPYFEQTLICWVTKNPKVSKNK